MSAREFEDIYFADARKSAFEGKLRIAPPGIGWKSSEDELFTIKADNLSKLQFMRCCRRYQLRIHLLSPHLLPPAAPSLPQEQKARDENLKQQPLQLHVVKFENFSRESFEEIRDAVRQNYSMPLELVELCVKGMNWGKTELLQSSLAFVSAPGGKPVFEIPYAEIYNVSAAKNEVALDFVGPEGASAAKQAPPMAALARRLAPDQLSEIRFYVPGMAGRNGGGDDDDDDDDDAALAEDNAAAADNDVDMAVADGNANGPAAALSAADRLCRALKARSEFGVEKSDTICSLKELPFLTPRGRYDVDMFMDFLRLRGKSYDYKIAYSSITRMFLLPKPGDQQMFLIIGLNPPLRQGQTRYDFLVQQFLREDEMQAEITLDESALQERFRGALLKRYDARSFEVVSMIFRGVTNVRMTIPGAYRSPTSGGAGIRCSLKAQEGFLYALERELLFVPKLSRHIEHSEISHVTFSRVSGGSSRTFDLVVALRGGGQSVAFSNISREEYVALEEYFGAKSIRTKNELSALDGSGAAANGGALGAPALGDSDDDDDDDNDSDDSDGNGRVSGLIEDSDDDDVANSDDADFIAASDSDASDEFDSDELDSDQSDSGENIVREAKKRKPSERRAERKDMTKRPRL